MEDAIVKYFSESIEFDEMKDLCHYILVLPSNKFKALRQPPWPALDMASLTTPHISYCTPPIHFASAHRALLQPVSIGSVPF